MASASDIYFAQFDAAVLSAGLFSANLSATRVRPAHLTGQEIQHRQDWSATIDTLLQHYVTSQVDALKPVVNTQELLLQQRLVPPTLNWESFSDRSGPNEPRKGRMYPPSQAFRAWDGFQQEVEAFNLGPSGNQVRNEYGVLFQPNFPLQLATSRKFRSRRESGEQTWLFGEIKRTLEVGDVLECAEKMPHGAIGKPDLYFERLGGGGNGGIAVVIEMKSSHNLLLPPLATEFVDLYERAYNQVFVQFQGRTTEHSNACHPTAQLLGYMADNGRRFGILTCSSYAYFFKIEGNGGDSTIHISDRWTTGRPNFLRALAYMNACGNAQNDNFAPATEGNAKWKRTTDGSTPPRRPSRKSRRLSGDGVEYGLGGDLSEMGNGEGGGGGVAASSEEAESASIPSVGLSDIKIIKELGYGRNGSVFLARWRDRDVAMKQFDIVGDGSQAFQQELSAYVRLENEWGVLVPEPLFLSESLSGRVRFLGLELGRTPRPGDDLSAWPSILRSIQHNYGMKLLDAEHEGNRVFIRDEESGIERLVAIDLEDYELHPLGHKS